MGCSLRPTAQGATAVMRIKKIMENDQEVEKRKDSILIQCSIMSAPTAQRMVSVVTHPK